MNSYSRILNWINHHLDLVTCYCRNPGNLLWVSPTFYNLKGYFPFSSSIMIHINFSLKVSRAASASPHLVSGVFSVAISGDLGTPRRSESWCLADLANLANLPSSIILNTRNINFINTDKCLNLNPNICWTPSSRQRRSSTLMQHSTESWPQSAAAQSPVCPGPGPAVTSAVTTELWWC